MLTSLTEFNSQKKSPDENNSSLGDVSSAHRDRYVCRSRRACRDKDRGQGRGHLGAAARPSCEQASPEVSEFIYSVQLAKEEQRGETLCTSGFSSLPPRHPQPPARAAPRVPQQAPRDDAKGAGTSVIGWAKRREAAEDEVR